jgi:hypothetical protein
MGTIVLFLFINLRKSTSVSPMGMDGEKCRGGTGTRKNIR